MKDSLILNPNVEGPQFSTRAESHMYRSWGGSVINMSVLPEAKLAREAEIAYQMICMSTDYDCWHDSADVTVEMVMGNMKANADNARRFVTAVLDALAADEHSDLVQAKHLAGSVKFGLSTPKSIALKHIVAENSLTPSNPQCRGRRPGWCESVP